MEVLFDIASLENRLKELEELTTKEGFWEDNTKSAKVLQEIKDIKHKLDGFNKLKQAYEDIEVLITIGMEEQDEEVIPEVRQTYKQLLKSMDKLEVEVLLNGKYDCTIQQIKPTPKERKPLLLPPKHDNLRRVFAYLVNQRGIDREVLHEFVHAKMIYECATFHNVVFVGYDKNGVPRHAHRRSIGSESRHRYTVAGSDAEYSFHWNGTNDTLYLFEAPIDMLSFITMNQDDWKNNSYAASCSVSDRVLFRCLEDNPNISKVYLCFDSDEAGQRSAKAIEDKLFTTRGIESEILIPKHKDWNDDLLSLRKEEHQWKV